MAVELSSHLSLINHENNICSETNVLSSLIFISKFFKKKLTLNKLRIHNKLQEGNTYSSV
jgi:hypothetical protein